MRWRATRERCGTTGLLSLPKVCSVLHVNLCVDCVSVAFNTNPSPAVLKEIFTRHLLTAEECSEVAGKGGQVWENHLHKVVLFKPAEIVQEMNQVLGKHGCHVEEPKSEFCYIVFYQVVTHIRTSTHNTRTQHTHMHTLTHTHTHR